jgi:hypothetical protein
MTAQSRSCGESLSDEIRHTVTKMSDDDDVDERRLPTVHCAVYRDDYNSAFNSVSRPFLPDSERGHGHLVTYRWQMLTNSESG